jgi:hypothetical protein
MRVLLGTGSNTQNAEIAREISKVLIFNKQLINMWRFVSMNNMRINK